LIGLGLALTALMAAPQPFKLAAPGFTSLNLGEDAAKYYSEHFAHQLSAQKIRVTTPTEMSALLGVERPRHRQICCSNKCVHGECN
jgi:hypothetical protein